MSFKDEIDKIKGVGTNHEKYAHDFYWEIVKKDVENIKQQILTQAKEGKNGYNGIVRIEFNQGKEPERLIPYTLPGVYEGYTITKYNDKFSRLSLQNKVFEEKIQHINKDGEIFFSLDLTIIGGPYLHDITYLCGKEGIELNCYAHGLGRVKTKSGTSAKFYDMVKFNHNYKTSSFHTVWELRAKYKVN